MILGLIPARGGSRRIPNKNIKLFRGRPLIAWTILEAKKSAYLDQIIVSTDDKEIAEVAMDYRLDIINRPPLLAKDDTPMYPVIGHAIDWAGLVNDDAICLLHPTSPLRIAEDIDACCALFLDTVDCHAVVSVTEGENVPNGAVYIGRVHWLNTGGNFDFGKPLRYEMPKARSADINTPEEFDAAETQAIMSDVADKYHKTLVRLASK